MKIRRGFVTNSSSSSFVIAKKGNVDKTRLYYELLDESILNEIVEEPEYFDFLPYPEEILDLIKRNKLDEVKKELIKAIVDKMIQSSPDLKLDDWDINMGECNNETDCILDFFIYGLEHNIDFNDFKIKQSYC